MDLQQTQRIDSHRLSRTIHAGSKVLDSLQPQPLNFFAHKLIPIFLMVFVPNAMVCCVSFVVNHGSSTSEALKMGFLNFWYTSWANANAGNVKIWTFLGLYVAYTAACVLVLPGIIYYGPPMLTGEKLAYRKTSMLYYGLTMAVAACSFLILDIRCWPIYKSLPGVTVALVVTGYVVTILLYLKGRLHPSPGEHGTTGSVIFDFYWGLELCPRLGEWFDVKLWTNCRFGMMAWQLLVLVAWKAQVESKGWNWSMATTATVQTLHIAKCFFWEDGYMHTIDITYDRAGFYICWGCICYLSLFYPRTSLYMVSNSPERGPGSAVLITTIGIILIAVCYRSDYEKQLVKATQGKCTIWGQPPKLIHAVYVDATGKQRTNVLLASGFWSLSRHANYVLDILTGLCWALPSGFHSLVPYFYTIYLVGLHIHRTYRDDEKCSKKYGKNWEEYCSIAKYRMVPYLF